MDLLAWLMTQTALGAFATLGFAVWFRVPRETLTRVVLVGTVGFLVRQVLNDFGVAPPVSSFWAALLIGVFGLERARTFHYPRVIFTVTGVIPLVPGISAYESLVRFTEGDLDGGIASMVRATAIILALAGGLAAARSIGLPWRAAR
ncbi:MAG: threonine/serine exporter family protein [Polyangiaceae bacterium]|nr:threonine/serine exporter family protein [Polyangiaceae bacterium]